MEFFFDIPPYGCHFLVITISVIKMTIFLHGGKSEIFILPYVLDLMDLLEQNFCQDSNLRVKLMYELVK